MHYTIILIETKQKTRVRLAPILLATTLGVGLVVAFALFALGKSRTPAASPVQITQVEDLAVQIMNKVSEYNAMLPEDRHQELVTLVTLIEKRRAELRKLVASDPNHFLALALSPELEQLIPQALKPLIEKQTTIVGTLKIVHYDFPDGTSRTDITFQSDDGQILKPHFAKPANYKHGSRLTLTGVLLDNDLVVDQASAKNDVNANVPEIASVGPVKTAVILFNYLNDHDEPLTPTEARDWVFTRPVDPTQLWMNSAKTWYREASNNRINLVGQDLNEDGDVYGYVTLPINTPGCDGALINETDTILTTAGLEENDYDAFVLVFPGRRTCSSYFAYGKFAFVPHFVDSIFPLENRPFIHELGHVLGLYHANHYRCYDALGQATPLSGTCERWNYEDVYDVMGGFYRPNSKPTFHFNSFNKEQLGIIDPTQIQTATLNGSYTIVPQQPVGPGFRSLRVPRKYNGTVVQDYWYFELRQPYGLFDQDYTDSRGSFVNFHGGLLARIAPDFYNGYAEQLLIDPSPSPTSPSTQIAGMPVGFILDDQAEGIRVTPTTVTATIATVDVTLYCISKKPEVSVVPTDNVRYGHAGDTVTYTLTITNADTSGCAGSTFTLTPTLPSGWTHTTTPIALLPHTSAQVTLSVTSPGTATDRFYSIPVNATAAGHSPSWPIYMVYYVDGTGPTVSIASPADGAQYAVEDGPVLFQADAADSNGVTSIELLIDNVRVRLCESTTACGFSWSLIGASIGEHRLKVIAQDNTPMRNSTTREINVTIAGNRPPPPRRPPVEITP